MDWVECKSVRVLRPDFEEVFVGSPSLKNFGSPGEVEDCKEV